MRTLLKKLRKWLAIRAYSSNVDWLLANVSTAANDLLFQARNVAMSKHHDWIGTEHLLIAAIELRIELVFSILDYYRIEIGALLSDLHSTPEGRRALDQLPEEWTESLRAVVASAIELRSPEKASVNDLIRSLFSVRSSAASVFLRKHGAGSFPPQIAWDK